MEIDPKMVVRVNPQAKIWIIDCGPWRDADSALPACIVCAACCDSRRPWTVKQVVGTCSAQDLHVKKDDQKRLKFDQVMDC